MPAICAATSTSRRARTFAVEVRKCEMDPRTATSTATGTASFAASSDALVSPSLADCHSCAAYPPTHSITTARIKP